MELPDFPEISPDVLQSIINRHELGIQTISRMPEIGIFNAIYLLDDELILRIPRNHPHFVKATVKEATVVPIVHTAGVRTPRLIVFDDSCELLPVPYSVYERVHGATLELIQPDPVETPKVYRELGRDLALLHAKVTNDGAVGLIGGPSLPTDDPRPLPDQLASEGYFSIVEARWLTQWIKRLMDMTRTPVPKSFLHGDTQATNIMVDADTLAYRALIDWGSCGWGDPALDFAGMPLRAVPDVLVGYRETALVPHDKTAEARILLAHLHIALLNLCRDPQPLRSWAERPTGYLLNIMRFLLEESSDQWRELRPLSGIDNVA